jgi:ATP synthase protein I
MFRVVAIQAGTAFGVAIVAAVLAGMRGAESALWGGFACVLPNALFAAHLKLRTLIPPPDTVEGSSHATRVAVGLLAGEFLKVFLTIALLALGPKVFPGLVWPALIASVMATLLVAPAAHFWRPN